MKRANVIVQQSTNDVFTEASKTAPGTNRGGSVQPGFVPRDIGFLAVSAVFELNGSRAGKGENAFEMGIAGMEAGDTAVLKWPADYASAVHYRGWLWVDTAASQWPEIVARNVRKAKIQVAG